MRYFKRNKFHKSYLKDKSFEEKFDPETKPQKIEKLYTPKPKSIPKKK